MGLIAPLYSTICFKGVNVAPRSLTMQNPWTGLHRPASVLGWILGCGPYPLCPRSSLWE